MKNMRERVRGLVDYLPELAAFAFAVVLFVNGGVAFGLAFLASICFSLGHRALKRTSGEG